LGAAAGRRLILSSFLTFTQAVDAFGIWIGGAGDLGTINLAAGNAVPEPASTLLLGIAGAGLLASRRKRTARP